MSDFNYDRAQLAALGTPVVKQGSPSTVFNNEGDLNRKKPQQNQEVTPEEKQLEFSFMKGPR